MHNHDVIISQTEDGLFVAASTASPFFCFEGATEEVVLARVRNALNFYYKAKSESQPKPSRAATTTFRRLVPRRSIASKELVAA